MHEVACGADVPCSCHGMLDVHGHASTDVNREDYCIALSLKECNNDSTFISVDTPATFCVLENSV